MATFVFVQISLALVVGRSKYDEALSAACNVGITLYCDSIYVLEKRNALFELHVSWMGNI